MHCAHAPGSAAQAACCFLIDDVCFYGAFRRGRVRAGGGISEEAAAYHRVLHAHRGLYRAFHAPHHEFTAPFGWASAACRQHPHRRGAREPGRAGGRLLRRCRQPCDPDHAVHLSAARRRGVRCSGRARRRRLHPHPRVHRLLVQLQCVTSALQLSGAHSPSPSQLAALACLGQTACPPATVIGSAGRRLSPRRRARGRTAGCSPSAVSGRPCPIRP